MAPMLSALYDCKTVVVDKKIYVIGGRTKQHNEVKNVEVYDTRTNTWQKCKPMIKEMYYFSVS